MKARLVVSLLLLLFVWQNIAAQQVRIIEADFNRSAGPRSQVYKECVGAGRASEGLRADWQQQLIYIQKELGFKYIRFHGLLNDDMHVYTEDKNGNTLYNWQYVDKLYDFLLSVGIKPFVELGFMPPDLASGTKTVFWWKGNVTPPKSYEKWEALIKALVMHFEERYGKAEVEKWYFEVWNEPDLGGFWAGTQQEYFKLYQCSVNAVKSVSKTYRVGGPGTARQPWIHPFLDYCAANNLPVDFVSTHSYNTKSVLDEFGTGRRRLLDENYLPDAVQRARRVVDSTIYKGAELHYTEFNSSPSSRDPLHDTYQNAAWLLSTLKRTEKGVNSMSYWTFTDIFEEAGPAMTPLHGGFGLLNLQGIRKPSFFAYKFLNQLGETELVNADTNSWVCKTKNGVQVLFWNRHMPFNDTTKYNETYFRNKIEAPDAGTVNIKVKNVPNGNYELQVFKTGYHSNDVFSAYLEMGSPRSLSQKQEQELRKVVSGEPISKTKITITNGVFSWKSADRENDAWLIKLVRI